MFTDGAWEGEDQARSGGNADEGGAKGPPPPAGWGVAEFSQFATSPGLRSRAIEGIDFPVTQLVQGGGTDGGGTARLTAVDAGPVVTEEDVEKGAAAADAVYIGAPTHTNNTGEITALHVALTRALRRPRGAGREEIHTDSLYALNMATGKWMPSRGHRNTEMVAGLRRLWRQLQRARPHEVRLRHVRSHTRVAGNELADWLADAGARGGRPCRAASEQWLRGWLAEQRRREGAHPAPADEHEADDPGDPDRDGDSDDDPTSDTGRPPGDG